MININNFANVISSISEILGESAVADVRRELKEVRHLAVSVKGDVGIALLNSKVELLKAHLEDLQEEAEYTVQREYYNSREHINSWAEAMIAKIKARNANKPLIPIFGTKAYWEAKKTSQNFGAELGIQDAHVQYEELGTKRSEIERAFAEWTKVSFHVPVIRFTESGRVETDVVLRSVVPQFGDFWKNTQNYFWEVRQNKGKDGKITVSGQMITMMDIATDIIIVDFKDYLNVAPKVCRSHIGIESQELAIRTTRNGMTVLAKNRSFGRDDAGWKNLITGLPFDGDVDDSWSRFGGKNGGILINKSAFKEHRWVLLKNNDASAVEKLANEMSCGYWDILQSQGEISANKAVKVAGRLANHMSPECGRDIPVDCVAIFMGKYFNSAMDGISFTTLLDPGYASHNRAYSMKDQLVGVTERCFLGLMKQVAASHEIVWLERASISSDIQKKLNAAFDGKGDLANKIVIVCDHKGQLPEVFGDLNSFKTPWNLKVISGFNSMGLYHMNENRKKVTFSSQGVMKALCVDSRDIEAVNAEFTSAFLNIWKNQISDMKEIHAPKIQDAEDLKKLLLQDSVIAMTAIDPTATERFPYLLRRYWTMKFNTLQDCVKRLAIDVEGRYLVARCDLGVAFGQEILAPTEILLNNSDLEGRNVIVLKYPSTGINEFVVARVLSRREYKYRVRKLVRDGKIQKWQANVIMDYAENLHDSCMVSANPILPHLLAGFDFDTDHVSIIAERSIVDFYSKYMESVAVFIDPPTASDDGTVAIDGSFVGVAAEIFDKSGMKSVGQVTNVHKLVQAFYTNRDLEGFREFLFKAGLLYTNRVGEYKPVFVKKFDEATGFYTVNANKDMVKSMFYQIRSMKNSLKNLELVLRDWVTALPRFDQEVLVDAAGHGYIHHMGGNAGTEYYVMQATKKFNADNIMFNISYKDGNASFHAETEISEAWNKVGQLQKAMADVAVKELAPAIEYAFNNGCKISHEEVASIRDFFNNWVVNHDALATVVERTLRMIWTLGHKYSLSVKDGDTSFYHDYAVIIEGSIRKTLASLMPQDRFRVIFAIASSIDAKGKDGKLVRKLGTVLFREEMAKYLGRTTESDEISELVKNVDLDMPVNTTDILVPMFGNAKNPDETNRFAKTCNCLPNHKIQLYKAGKMLHMRVTKADNSSAKLPYGISVEDDLSRNALANKIFIVSDVLYAGEQLNGKLNAIVKLNVVKEEGGAAH